MNQSPWNALPRRQPEAIGARLLLFGIRQMGAGGLNDAAAANAFLTAFGKGFRRPLLLLRALMADMARGADAPIQIASWRCCRMTRAEGAVLDAVARAPDNPALANLLLADVMSVRDAMGAVATAAALGACFADLGLPLAAQGVTGTATSR